MIAPTTSLARRIAGWLPLRWLPLDLALRASQRLTLLFARLLFVRDWQLEARGRPQFFKHSMNLAHWPFDPARWAFAARGVHPREAMRRGCRVLDLCCGDGAYSRLFFADIAGHVDAVDLDRHAIAYARRYHAARNIVYRELDIVQQPFPANDYDIVVWNAAICYFTESDIRAILKKIVAASRPEMCFFGMLPRANGWIDHRTEFADTNAVEAFLGDYFSKVAVREVDEGAAVTFYFVASAPLAHSRAVE
jgi:SAM-dependent methyltransferase